jgi:hypothetical protein
MSLNFSGSPTKRVPRPSATTADLEPPVEASPSDSQKTNFAIAPSVEDTSAHGEALWKVRSIRGPRDLVAEVDGMMVKARVRDSSRYRPGMDLRPHMRLRDGMLWEETPPKPGRTA